MLFRETVILYSQSGALPAAGLDSLVAQARGVDMQQVREDIAAQEREQAAS
jgi:hypothetical protein